MTEQNLKVEEVALLLGVSTQTINNWYRWKKLNPEHELCEFLPDFTQSGERQKRFWKKSDIWSLVQFKNSIPHGRNGILGDVTQIHIRKRKKEKNNETEN